MAVPRVRKPPEQLRRRNSPEVWVVLPAEGCKIPAPTWPNGKPSTAEASLWKRLWALPVASWWHEQQIEPFVVARYVVMACRNPALTAVSRLEGDLGLTPAGMARLRLVVESGDGAARPAKAGRYAHIRAVD